LIVGRCEPPDEGKERHFFARGNGIMLSPPSGGGYDGD